MGKVRQQDSGQSLVRWGFGTILRRWALGGVPMLVTLSPLPAEPLPSPTSIANPAGATFVQLFEWPWSAVAQDCETWLGPLGYEAVQISPAQEHRVVVKPDWNPQVIFPWYQRYQPVSYRLESRGGDRSQVQAMVQRCHQAGVAVYGDVVLNHLAGSYAGLGGWSGGSGFITNFFSYPGVPYDRHAFHEPCQIQPQDYQEQGYRVQHCQLLGLQDLKTESPQVQTRIRRYLQDLLDLGLGGWRVDGAKHIPSADLGAIFQGLTRPGQPRPFIFQEVINTQPEAIVPDDYLIHGSVTEFRYGRVVGQAFRSGQLTDLAQLPPLGDGLGPDGTPWLPSDQAIVFISNHDNQRGHGDGGIDHIVTFFEPADQGRTYGLAQVFLLTWPYGYPSLLSSYDWPRDWVVDSQTGQRYDRHDWMGPPADDQGQVQPVTCGQGWICEHRWPMLRNLVQFRRDLVGEPVTYWWDNGSDQIAFGRGDRGFVVINQSDRPLKRTLATGLPAGDYANILGDQTTPPLTQTIPPSPPLQSDPEDPTPPVTVTEGGWVQVELPPHWALVLLKH